MTTLDTPTTAARARRAMIDSQLRTSGVTAPVAIARMAEVAREDFVPEAARAAAYGDRAIALGDGGFLPAPLVQGMMLQEAAPTASDHAILVDGGSGYLAQLLRPLVASLSVLTPAEALTQGDAQNATLLLVEGAAEMLPETLVARLADGARIVTGLSDKGVTRLAIGRKANGEAVLQPIADLGMPVFAAFAAPRRWSF